ncbi:MAG: ROK family protein [Candidatus Methylarchaceae archaeon HK02M2]|nr:ROK family protein [Candidatus Methylarchaceae archaeon HK02M2]
MMERNVTSLPTLGVDLGGTKVKTALVDVNGQILSAHKYPTHPEKGSDKIITDILTSIDECLDKARQEAKVLGIGIAGQVDFKGVVHYAPNLKWRNVPLKEKLEEKLGLPVIVVNDVRAATWGEWRYGSGKGVDDLIVLFVGTGIGGGVISGGKILVGCSNTGGELGHITIVYGGRSCRCPNMGCLEAYAGGWAIAERAQEAVRSDPEAWQYLTSLAGSIENITAATVGHAYREGDQKAHQLVKETGQYLAAGAVSIVNAFNPCLFVLGGGVIEGLPDLIQIVENFTRKKALESALKNLKFVKAALGDDAGVIGAAALAQNKIYGLHKLSEW